MLFYVLYIQEHVPVIQQQHISHKYEYQLVLFLKCSYYIKTLKFCLYHNLYSNTCYIHDYVYMILVAGLRHVPSLLYVVFLGVIYYGSQVVTVYQCDVEYTK